MVNLLHLNIPLIPVSYIGRIQACSALDPHYLFDIYVLFIAAPLSEAQLMQFSFLDTAIIELSYLK
jgi:hypothetical protein